MFYIISSRAALLLQLIFLALCVQLAITISPFHEGYDRPVMPSSVPDVFNFTGSEPYMKLIPQHIWIAVRDISDDRPVHLAEFLKKNINWTVHYCDNDLKDQFMETVFANTSTLWAYNILNPIIGTAKVELWRLAVLYVYGGLYMDDDATLATPLDEIVEENDKFIIAKEPGTFDDRCYVDSYPLSNFSMIQRFGPAAYKNPIFDDKFWVNWAIFSTPRHPLLVRVLEHITALIRFEYFGESAIKMHVNDHRGKLLMCASTHPIYHSAREMILENITDLGIKVGDDHFINYGGNMKAWYNDYVVPNQ